MSKPAKLLSSVGKCAALSIIGCLYCLGTTVPPKKAIKVSLCQLVTAPDQYNNTLVEVRSSVESDGMHAAGLIDKACQGKAVELLFDSSSDEQSTEAFRRAVFSGTPGTIDKKITGVFVGTFHWHANQIPARIINVKKVCHLKVRKTSGGEER